MGSSLKQAAGPFEDQAAFEDHGPHREEGFQCSQHSDPENPGLWILAGKLKFSELVNELRVGIQESWGRNRGNLG